MKHRILSMLVLLMTAATGAWAQTAFVVKELVPPAEWENNSSSFLTSDDMPSDFKPITKDEALAWTGAPATGTAYLFYAFNGTWSYYIKYDNGTPMSDYCLWEHSFLYSRITNNEFKVYYSVDPDAVAVTTEPTGATAFTTASFNMPTFDATVKYVMARDLRVDVEFSGLPTKILLRKDEIDPSKYYFDDATVFRSFQLLDKLDANDIKDITHSNDFIYYVGKLVEQQDNPGEYSYEEATQFTLLEFLDTPPVPGKYELRAVANADGPYYSYCSTPFDLVEGYPVEVPAGDFVTYFSDENLTVDTESGAVLYTITNVSGNTATATQIPSANAGMPFLIFNSTDEDKTFLIYPTDDVIKLNVYPGFKGTLEGKTFTAAEMAATDHYVVNNAQFVWVKDPGTIAANRCWLEKTKNSAARAITILFGDATGITAVSGSAADNGDIYDLNGRKVQRPVKKGVYIQNGQKIIIK